MSYSVAENIDLVRDVASGLPDDVYDPDWHVRPDDLGPSDCDFDDFAMSMWDPVEGWVDA